MTGLARGLRVSFALIGPALVIFVSSALDLLGRNAEYFTTGIAPILPFLLAGSAYLAVGAALYRLASSSRLAESAFFAYLLTGPLWLIHSALIDFAGKGTLIGVVVVSAVGGVCLTRAKRAADALVAALSLFGLAVLVATAANALQLRSADASGRQSTPAGFESWERANGAAPSANLPDIYHIVFDEFQTEMFRAVLDDDLTEKLGGVVWFPNSSTPYGRTEMALASVFAGVPYDYREPPFDYMRKAFASEKALLNQLRSLGYRTIGFLHQVYPRGLRSPFDHTYFHTDMKRIVDPSEQRSLFTSLWLYAYLPGFVTRHVLPKHHYDQLSRQALLPDGAVFLSFLSFRRFLEWESKSARTGARYMFVHLLLPHFPNVMGANCSYQPGLRTGVVEQTSCTMRVIAEFLDSLEDRGRFKDAMILLHGDHGSRYLSEGGRLRTAQGGNYGGEVSWARSRPLLLVKPSGIDRGRRFLVDERATDLFDLFPTVFANLGKTPRGKLAGSSLLADPVSGRVRYYHFYDKDKDRTRVVDGTLKRYRISRTGEVTFDTEIRLVDRK